MVNRKASIVAGLFFFSSMISLCVPGLFHRHDEILCNLRGRAMTRFISGIFLAGMTIFCCGCQFFNTANTYTPEATYQKLVREYPFISIADQDVPASVIERKNITYVRYGIKKLQL